MNFLAVEDASDDQLSELGVAWKGDVLSLRGFVKEKMRSAHRDEKKRKRLNLKKERVKPKKKKVEEKTSTRPGSSKENKDSLRRILSLQSRESSSGGGVLDISLGGRCGPPPQTLTLFKT